MANEGERGAAALLAICAMTVVLWLAMGLHAAVEYGTRGSEEFIQESRLRLAAEGRVEMLAREIERCPAAVDGLPKGKWQPYGGEYSDQGIQVTVSLRHIACTQGEEGEDIFLKAWAEPGEKEKWSKGKLVCGWLHRKEESCVWRGWRSVEE